MKTLVIVLIVLLLIAVIALVVVVVRYGLRSYQRYSGLERQRGSAKQSRNAGADRLKTAERYLVEAQRQLAERGEYSQTQPIERLRQRLSTLADRLRHATYGYAPLNSPNPIREAELAELQERDSETITESQSIVELAEDVSTAVRMGSEPDLEALRLALEHLQTTLDRRKAVN